MAVALGAGVLTVPGQPARVLPATTLASSAGGSDPSASENVLTSVSAVSASDAWAAGYYVNTSGTGTDFTTLTLHWNGTAWSQVASPNPGFDNILEGVSTVSASDAWAVRDSYNPTTKATHTFILRWNGTAWSRVTSPNPSPAASTLASVSAVSGTDAWSAGWYRNSTANATDTLILRWNGTTWSKVTSPSPSSSESLLGGVSAASGSNAWAVGSYVSSTNATDTLVLHWNGTAWSQAPSPDPGATINELRGVSTVSPTDAWAVGVYHDNTANTTHTLILRWDGTTWSVSPH